MFKKNVSLVKGKLALVIAFISCHENYVVGKVAEIYCLPFSPVGGALIKQYICSKWVFSFEIMNIENIHMKSRIVGNAALI